VDAVESLRALVDRSKRYLLTAIRQGVLEGAVRSDIEPEALLVVVIGTAHALAGMSGVHRPDDDSTFPEPDEVLASLERILAPPRPAAARPKARKKNRNP
jgi:hypothetical protein